MEPKIEEIWKDVIGFEGFYQVSSLGRIKRSFANGDKIIKLHTEPAGYQLYSFSVRELKRTIRIHRVVAEAFIQNPECKPQINHIDGIKSNNAASNLEWCTSKENVRHAISNGLTPKREKSIRYPNYWLTWR